MFVASDSIRGICCVCFNGCSFTAISLWGYVSGGLPFR